tara:strand:- start:688 stop:6591 length:5904 start_codon:yes stop_codon:yes gene_type:complete
MAFRQIKSAALADKAVLNTKLDESAVQGQTVLTGMADPAQCFTLLYDVGTDALKKISADAFFASFSSTDLSEGTNLYFTDARASTAVASDIASSVLVETNRASAAETLLQSNIAAEAATRASADVTLQSNISAEATRATLREDAIEAASVSADSGLSTRIDNILNNTDPASIDSFVEIIEAFEDADDVLSASVIANSSAITAETARAIGVSTTNATAIAVETARATAAEVANTSLLSAEEAARIAADSALAARVTTEEQATVSLQAQVTAEASTARAAESVNATGLATETTRATAAEAAISLNLTDEITARAVADTQVRTDIAADIVTAQAAAQTHAEAQDDLHIGDGTVDGTAGNTVTDRIATAKSTAESVASADASAKVLVEKTRAEAAESGLQSQITSNDTELAALVSADSTESAARIAGDAGLQTQIDFITTNTDPATLDSLTEIVAAFEGADSDISALIASNTTAISSETTRATGAESVLQTNITAEASTRGTADTGLQTAITAEETARIAADAATLVSAKAYTDQEADSHQAVATAHADAQDAALIGDNSVNGTVGNTVTARIATAKSQSNAFTSSQVSAEAATRLAADDALSLRTTSLEGDMTTVEALAAQNEIDLRAEEVTRASGDSSLQGQIDAEEAARILADSTLTTNLATEVSRAQGVEATNAAAVVTERVRAEAVEAGLRTDVNTNTVNITANAGTISGENTRALAAESALGTRIDSAETLQAADHADNQAQITAEVTRASGVEAGLQTAVTSNQTQITANDGDIAALSTLQSTDHADNQAQITAEVTRASAAEVVNADAVVAETTRASAIEAGLRTDVDSNQTQITANDADILALETLQSSDHDDNQAQITAEVARATAAEVVNAAATAAEKTRAEGIEAGLRTDVDSNQTQITANDADILALTNLQAADHADNQTQLTAEVNRATGIEAGLRTDVDLVESRVDAIIGTSSATLDTLQEIVTAFETADTSLDGVITANSGRLTVNESDIDAVEVRATDLETRATAVEGRATSLETGQGTQNGRLTVNESDIDALEAKQGSATLATVATDVSAAINEIHAELDTEAGHVDTLQTELDAVEVRASSLETEQGLQGGRLTSVEGRATAVESRATALETKQGSATLTTTATDVSAAINELVSSLGSSGTTAAGLAARVTTEEGNVDTLQAEMTAVEGRATSLETRVTTEEGNVDTLQTQMGSTVLATVATDVTGAVNEIHTELDAEAVKVATLESEMNAVEGRATAVESRATALETEQGLQGGRLTVNEGDIDDLETKLGTGVFDTTSQIITGAVNELHSEVNTNTSGLASAVSRADADSDALASEILSRTAADTLIRTDLAAFRTTDQADYIARDAAVLASAQSYAESEADDGEAAAKIYADGIVASEATLRNNADLVLAGQITTEATARQVADNGLDTRLGVVEGEMSATQLAAGVNANGTYDTPTSTTYLDASTSLADADKKLDTALTSEVASRVSGDASLQSQITAEIARAGAAEGVNSTGLAAEIVRATAAEVANGVLITTNASSIASESSRAQGIEASLQTQVDFITSNTDAAALDSLTEIVTAFNGADSTLTGLVSANQTSIATNASGLAQEITDRIAGDTAVRSEFATADSGLQTQIDGKVAKSGDAMTGVLAMGSNKITGLADGVANGDAANKGQLVSGLAAQHISQFSTSDLSEGSNEYFTAAKVHAAVSVVDVSGEGNVSETAGVFSIDTAKSFLEISDVADTTYVGKNGWVARVKTDLSGLELIDPTELAFNDAQRQVLNGDGSTATFALTFYTLQANAMVFVGGVIQDPSTHYSIDAPNQSITFTSALPVGTQAVVIAQSTNSVGVLDPKSVGLETLSDNIKVFEQGTDVVAGTSATVVDTFNKVTTRTAKYIVTVENGGEFETRECLVIHDGTDAYITEFGILFTGSSLLGDTDVQVNGSSIELTYTAVTAGAVVSVSVTYTDA